MIQPNVVQPILAASDQQCPESSPGSLRHWASYKNRLTELETEKLGGIVYRIVKCEGDGNCFLRALSIALYHDRGARHQVLRQEMVAEMRKSQDKYIDFLTHEGSDEERCAIYKAMCVQMETSGEYVDHLGMYALSNVFQLEFLLFDEVENFVQRVSHGAGIGCPPIVLYFSNSNDDNLCHYDLLVEDNEQNWGRFYSTYYTSGFATDSEFFCDYESDNSGDGSEYSDCDNDVSTTEDYFNVDESEYSDCDDDDDDYVEGDRNEFSRKGRKRKRKAAGSGPSAPEKTATGSRKKNAKSSRKKNAKSRKYPPDHKPSTVSELFAAASDDCHL